MKNHILLVIFFSLNLLAYGQGSLSGKVTNTAGVSFTYCKLILAQDSVNLATVDADSLGRFAFSNLKDGNYTLHVKVPFKALDTLIVVSGATLFNLALDDAGVLDEVEITAKQPMIVRKVDRTIFNPADVPMLVGGDAADVIEFAPGVMIQGDQISVNGKGPAQVMLNDKLIQLRDASLISFIRSIPTEDIQYIEIIPIPPVKYASSVSGSLINIRLVIGSKSRHSNGSVTLSGSQHFYFQPAGSASYSYRDGRFSLYSNVSLGDSKYRSIGTTKIQYDSLTWDQKSIEVNRYLYGNGSIGINYELSKTTEVGLLGVLYFSQSGNQDLNGIETRNIQNSPVETIDNQTKIEGGSLDAAFNVNLTKRLDSLGRKIDFNVDYTNVIGNQTIDFTTRIRSSIQDSLNKEHTTRNSGANFLSGGIDYEHPFKKITWKLGGRYSYGENKVDLAVYNLIQNSNIPDTNRSNIFQYIEHIQAAYSSIEWKRKRWTFQVGLRGENTYYQALSPTTDLSVKRSYFQWEAKIFVMYEAKNGNAWNFSYWRGFSRPFFSALNPFPYYSSAFSYSKGNPNLNPMPMHAIDVSTSVKDFRFGIGVFLLNKMITEFTTFNDSTLVQQTSYYNLFSHRSADLSISYYKMFRKRFLIDASLRGFITNRKVLNGIDTQNLLVLTGDLSTTFGFVLDKKNTFQFNASVFIMSPYLEQITLTRTMPNLDFELKKIFLKNRLIVKLECSDPFKWRRRKSKMISNGTIVKKDFYQDTQSFGFSLVYKFGNNRLNVNQHSSNSTGEAGRAK